MLWFFNRSPYKCLPLILIHTRYSLALNHLIFLWAEARCPNGWTVGPNKSKCFGYIGSHLSWNESEILCNSRGGHLAALATTEELNFVENLCRNSTNGCWVGGIDVNTTSGLGWKWSDNTSQWNKSIPFLSNCSSLTCANNGSVDLCTLVINGSASLLHERCNRSHELICMSEIGTSLLLYRRHNTKMLDFLVPVVLFLCCFYQGVNATTCIATKNILSF